MRPYRVAHTSRAAVISGVEDPERLHRVLHPDNRAAQETKAGSAIKKETLLKGFSEDVEGSEVTEPLLKTIKKSDMSEILENVNENDYRDTLSNIPFSVEQSIKQFWLKVSQVMGPT